MVDIISSQVKQLTTEGTNWLNIDLVLNVILCSQMANYQNLEATEISFTLRLQNLTLE